MNFQPQFIALLVILVFAALVLLVIRASQRQAAVKKHLALTLGFEEVTSRPTHLIDRVESLYKRGENQSIRIEQVYTKRDYDQELFIFDIEDPSKDDSNLGSAVFGLISDQLALPHFSLTTLPGFNSGTVFGGIMEGLLDKVLSRSEKYLGLSRIELPDRPDFDEQVIIFGKDEAAVKELMKKVDLYSITSIKSPVHITGMNDLLTIDFTEMGPLNAQEFDLIAQHREFTRLISSFTN